MDKKVEQNQGSKLHAILFAAFEAFAKYGVKRTSMADIAEGANMSRAALYLHFKNKDDIFRSMIETYYSQACADVDQALGRGGSVTDQLLAGFKAQSGESFQALLDSPHGGEFLDVKSTARDAVEAGNSALAQLYAGWLDLHAQCGRVAYKEIAEDPLQVAQVMMKALDGLKSDVPSYDDYVSRRDMLARLFGAALTA